MSESWVIWWFEDFEGSIRDFFFSPKYSKVLRFAWSRVFESLHGITPPCFARSSHISHYLRPRNPAFHPRHTSAKPLESWKGSWRTSVRRFAKLNVSNRCDNYPPPPCFVRAGACAKENQNQGKGGRKERRVKKKKLEGGSGVSWKKKRRRRRKNPPTEVNCPASR